MLNGKHTAASRSFVESRYGTIRTNEWDYFAYHKFTEEDIEFYYHWGKTTENVTPEIDELIELLEKFENEGLRRVLQLFEEMDISFSLKQLKDLISEWECSVEDFLYIIQTTFAQKDINKPALFSLLKEVIQNTSSTMVVEYLKGFLRLFEDKKNVEGTIVYSKENIIDVVYNILSLKNLFMYYDNILQNIETSKVSFETLRKIVFLKDKDISSYIFIVMFWESPPSEDDLQILLTVKSKKMVKIIHDELHANEIPRDQLRIIAGFIPKLTSIILEKLKSAADKQKWGDLLEKLEKIPNKIALDIIEKDLDISLIDTFILPPAQVFNWERYVVRQLNWEENGGYGNQIAYGNFMHQTVISASLAMDHLDWGFDEIVDFCAKRRKEIAKISEHDDWKNFGCKRINTELEVQTTCEGIYAELGHEIINSYNDNSISGFVDVHFSQNSVFIKQRPSVKTKTSMYLNSFEIAIQDSNWKMGDSVPTNSDVTITHTFPPRINSEGWPLIKKIYNACLESKNAPELISNCAKLFWWVCAFKPWHRGDPSIAESIFKAILDNRGYDVPAWKKGVIPWVEATLEFDPENFAIDFPKLFDGEIKLKNRKVNAPGAVGLFPTHEKTSDNYVSPPSSNMEKKFN